MYIPDLITSVFFSNSVLSAKNLPENVFIKTNENVIVEYSRFTLADFFTGAIFNRISVDLICLKSNTFGQESRGKGRTTSVNVFSSFTIQIIMSLLSSITQIFFNYYKCEQKKFSNFSVNFYSWLKFQCSNRRRRILGSLDYFRLHRFGRIFHSR